MRGRNAVDVIAGVSCLDLKSHHDARGELVAFEPGHNLPFPCRRVFTIRVGDGRLDRGGHANSCDELIVALSGSVLVRVDNGFERDQVRLTSPDQAAWVQGGVLIDLCEFEAGTLLMVCASQSYADTEHYDCPQPDLLMDLSAA